MSFFKDFKDDLSQAVNELMPGEELKEEEKKEGQEQPDEVVNTLEQEVDVKSELQKLEGLFEKVEEPEETLENVIEKNQKEEAAKAEKEELKQEEKTVNNETMQKEVSDEVTIITEGTSLTGNLESTGSFELRGKIEGNVRCNGKMTVTGSIKGNSDAAEFFADAAKVEGEITTTGTVKIGLGSVVIGNISATSAVIAGAIKGDIDVQGPVVVDTSAVVMGNIKSRSVQINNGAVIEGFCSQCYADVDVNSLFDEKKGL
ncbi:polymer-forming cytoskeletal protein [Roseburia sp. 499]|uniref:polymer-forming cytoskeletal protein n=1 Tax=Roseburia sp. 499 TaxID=1261634 RepID=UPI0009523BC2|nr:polymer-forming cytoskeletal protein [Roseburia sp. 499]WVK71249.1 polymer-forming cytoskeletal protein [Roseburia sp. 499]